MRDTVQNPPKARMAVNIGVTGHRNLPAADEALLRERLSEILCLVRDAAREAAAALPECHAGAEPVLRLLSMLAEGSDQIAARCALELGYRLQCPLPMELGRYEGTFAAGEGRDGLRRLLAQAGSVLEIAGCSDIAERAFQNGGNVMLGHSDLLIAIWDGRDSGKVGGTFDIIESARRQSIPVLHVDAAAPHAVRFICGAGSGGWQDEVHAVLRGLLLPANTAAPAAYFRENSRAPSRAGLYRWVVSRLSDRAAGTHGGGTAAEAGEDGTRAHYLSANALAMRYGDVFRSAGVLRQLLPFAASVGLAVGFYASLLEGPGGAGPAFHGFLGVVGACGFALQAVFFAAVIGLSRLEKRGEWQRKFIDYRMLAELLRLYEYVRPSGLVVRGLSVPAYMSQVNVSWVNWHFRAIVREAGLPGGKLTREALAGCALALRQDLLPSQIRYHGNNTRAMFRIASRLEKTGIGIYYAGVAITALRAAVYAFTSVQPLVPLDDAGRQYLSKVFNMLSMVVPLFSSLAFGLSAQEGFDRIRARSEAMLGKLEALAERMEALERSDFNAFMDMAGQTAELILSEFTDWNAFIRTKSISDH